MNTRLGPRVFCFYFPYPRNQNSRYLQTLNLVGKSAPIGVLARVLRYQKEVVEVLTGDPVI